MRQSNFKSISLFLIAAVVTAAISVPARAATGYVSDSFYVPLRGGKGNQYRIIDGAVKTGVKLEILEQDGEWTLVQLPNGKKGYMRSQYVSRKPIAQMQVDQAKRELQQAVTTQQALQAQLAELKSENAQLKQQINTQGTELEDTATQLGEIRRIAASSVDLNKRHQELLHSHQLLQTKVDVLKAENNRYQNDNRQKWFFYGSASVLLGVFITLIIPYFKRPKRNSEWLN